jgi:hypothetical protein
MQWERACARLRHQSAASGLPQQAASHGLDSKSGSRPISRVLSRRQSVAIIHLRPPSPAACSDLPESAAGHGIAFLFGLAPGGVYLAAACCHPRGALLPHHFTLTPPPAEAGLGRYTFCCTFRGLAPPRGYLAPCPMEPGLSSPGTRPEAIAWPTPATIVARLKKGTEQIKLT